MRRRRPLRALTVWQPYAGLLATGRKAVENRSWAPRPGELRPGEHLAIHAGERYDRDSWAWVFALRRLLEPVGRWPKALDAPWPLSGSPPNRDADPAGVTPYGAIIGVCVLDEVRRAPRRFEDAGGAYPDPFWSDAPGNVGWYLRDAVPIEPVFCAGHRGLWLVQGSALERVRESYRAARPAPVAP